MKIYENNCVGCPTYCINCGRKETPHYYCDGKDCGEEFEPSELYDFYGEMLCKNCLTKQFKTIEEME